MSTVAFSLVLVLALMVTLFVWAFSLRKQNKRLATLLFINCIGLVFIAILLVVIGRNTDSSIDWRFTTFLQLILVLPLIAIPALFIREKRKRLSNILLGIVAVVLIFYILGLGILFFHQLTAVF